MSDNRPSPNSLDKIIKEYLTGYCLIERGFTEKTIKGKRETLLRLLLYLNKLPLSLESIKKYSKHLYQKGWKLLSIRSELIVIKTFVHYLYSREYLSENWSINLLLPKVRRQSLRIIPAKLAEKVVLKGTETGSGDNSRNRKAKKEHRLALKFILRTGLRLSELIKLRYDDINFENKTYVVHSKGGNLDILPLPEDMINVLKLRKARNRLFRVTPHTLNLVLKRGSKAFSINSKLTVHTLRHIFCTELLKAGVALQVVSRLMRHSSVRITDDVYSHYIISDLALALNTKHPLISKGLPIREVLREIEKVVKSSIVVGDNRFKLVTKKTNTTLQIKVRLLEGKGNTIHS